MTRRLTCERCSGCVSWQSGDVRSLPDPLFGPTKGSSGAGKAVPVVLNVRYDAVGVDMDDSKRNKAAKEIVEAAHDVFDKEGRFVLGGDLRGQDYALLVEVMDDASPNMGLAVLSGLTLGVLPAVATDDFTITATLESPNGKSLGTRKLRQKMTTLIQLFTVFGMPFASPGTVNDDLWRGVFRDLAVWTWDTIAQKPSPPAPASAPAEQAHR